MDPWIKQADQFTGDGVQRSDIGSFESIAVAARQGKVCQHGVAAVFVRDEVIGFVRKEDL